MKVYIVSIDGEFCRKAIEKGFLHEVDALNFVEEYNKFYEGRKYAEYEEVELE